MIMLFLSAMFIFCGLICGCMATVLMFIMLDWFIMEFPWDMTFMGCPWFGIALPNEDIFIPVGRVTFIGTCPLIICPRGLGFGWSPVKTGTLLAILGILGIICPIMLGFCPIISPMPPMPGFAILAIPSMPGMGVGCMFLGNLGSRTWGGMKAGCCCCCCWGLAPAGICCLNPDICCWWNCCPFICCCIGI